jgi:carboxylesterase type B
MSNQVMEYWTNFAKTGNPNSDGLVEWKLDSGNNENNALWFKGDAFKSDVNNQIIFSEMDENEAVNAVANFYASQF